MANKLIENASEVTIIWHNINSIIIIILIVVVVWLLFNWIVFFSTAPKG